MTGTGVTGTEEKQNFPFHSQQKLSSSSTQTSEYFLPSKAELFPTSHPTRKDRAELDCAHYSLQGHLPSLPCSPLLRSSFTCSPGSVSSSAAASMGNLTFSHPSMCPAGIQWLHRRRRALVSIFEATKEVLSVRIDQGFHPTAAMLRLGDEYPNWAGSSLLKPPKNNKTQTKKIKHIFSGDNLHFSNSKILKDFKTSF